MSFFAYIFYIILLIIPFLYIKDLRIFEGEITLNINYLNSSIQIYRDEYDIPHINGSTLKDCFFGLGYVHAQDRLFALSIKKIIFSGRLSEYFGSKTLDLDRFMRNLLLSRTSKENVDSFDELDRDVLQSYINGINYFADSLTFLPTEFWLTGIPLEKFEVEDGVTMFKFFSFVLTYDWQHEVLREKIAEIFDEELAEEMTAAYTKYQLEQTVVLNDEELKQSGLYKEFKEKKRRSKIHKHIPKKKYEIKEIGDVFHDLIDMIDSLGKGSNNWVIHGNLTKSGKPILANDPHLDNHLPSLWYLAELIFDNGKKFASGATLPGIPNILIGKTHFLSWGVTTLHSDTSDLYKETLNQEGDKYLYDGNYYPIEFIKEEIKVKGEESEILIIKKTRHGPILTFLQDMYNVNIEFNCTLSFAWTGYLKNDTTYKTMYNLYHLSENSSEINNILMNFVSPFMHLVWASNNGDIGYIAIGFMPKRNNPDESFFLAGELKENDWIGIIENMYKPQIINPKKGYIVSANNKFATDNVIFHRSIHQISTSRAFRIEQMIKEFVEKGIKIDTNHIKQMQTDTKDPYSEIVLPHLITILKNYIDKFNFSITEKKIIKILEEKLENWNSDVLKESVAACIFNVWELFYNSRLLGKIEDIQDRERIVFSLNFNHFIFRKIIDWATNKENLDSEWCYSKNHYIEGKNGTINNICIYQILHSFIDVYNFLKENFGDNINEWSWGKLHKMRYRHIPFSETPLRPLFEREREVNGNRRTINVAIPNYRTRSFKSIHSANIRFIMNIDQNEKSYYITDTGMGENIIGGRYGNWLDKHTNGEYLEMKFGIEKTKEYERKLEIKIKN